MALVIINHGETPPEMLWRACAALPPGVPVVVMIHGYRFSPSQPTSNPHRHILSLEPAEGSRRAVSWPRALGFRDPHDPADGLAIAYGWEAQGSLRSAYGRAGQVGADLAPLIDRLAGATGRPVGLIGHSLGARVALSAIADAAPGSVGRAILLAAAELRARAAEAMASPAGRAAEVINVTSRENDLYDLAMEVALSGGVRRALGFGLREARDNWLDLQIDAPETLQALRGMGFPVGGRTLRCCHWSPYLRDGVFQLYHAALRQPESLPLWLLRRHLPDHAAPRWSRLWTRIDGDGQAPTAAA